jgi:hypothetical protein
MTIELDSNQYRQQSEEEQYLSKRLSKGNPYKVPEEYFDHLSEQVMSRIDECEGAKVQKRHTIKKRLWAAAATVALVIGVSATLFFHQESIDVPHGQSLPSVFADNENDYFDDAADYLATDNNDIYTYLAYE